MMEALETPVQRLDDGWSGEGQVAELHDSERQAVELLRLFDQHLPFAGRVTELRPPARPTPIRSLGSHRPSPHFYHPKQVATPSRSGGKRGFSLCGPRVPPRTAGPLVGGRKKSPRFSGTDVRVLGSPTRHDGDDATPPATVQGCH